MRKIRLKKERSMLSRRDLPKKRSVQRNPRRANTRDALHNILRRYENFEEANRDYWNHCFRGVYWYPVDEENWEITVHELKKGYLTVGCTPDDILVGQNEKKHFVAEIDASRILREDTKAFKNGKVRLNNVAALNVLRVVPAHRVRNIYKYQHRYLPSSEESLYEEWKKARGSAEMLPKKRKKR